MATPTGETPIGQLQVGNPVVAYDPQSDATSTQHVEHVFIDHDTDLLDVTLHKDQAAKTASTAADSQNGSSSKDTASDEVVHTTVSHPWLTADSGWVRAGKLHVGERVVRADGSSAVVAAIRVIPGAANMYDLTVSNIHAFIVGSGQYVVHNCAKSSFPPASAEPPVFNDPTQSPGPDWEWRGRGTPADGRGNWYNPNTFEKWNPDLSHPLPIGPHWDYSFDGMPGKGWRFMPDRTYVPKS